MLLFLYSLCLLALLLFPERYCAIARDALMVWSHDVVPSLFPYMVFCRLVSQHLQKLSFSPIPCIVLLGFAGGSPSGAFVISSYNQRLSRREILSLCALTGTISPVFFLSTVNAWIHMPRFCAALTFSHFLSAAFAGITVYFSSAEKNTFTIIQNPQSSNSKADQNPIVECIQSVLNVGGCIVVFSVLGGILSLVIPESITVKIQPILEIAGGLHAFFENWTDSARGRILVSALSSFGGFSNLVQNFIVLKPLHICFSDLLRFAVLRTVFASLFMMLLHQVSMV